MTEEYTTPHYNSSSDKKKEELSDNELVTLLQDLNDKVDAIQRRQAVLRLDIVDQLYQLLTKRARDERIRKRERCW